MKQSGVIHFWQPGTNARTVCGLWFKTISGLVKPNIISMAQRTSVNTRSVCKTCNRSR